MRGLGKVHGHLWYDDVPAQGAFLHPCHALVLWSTSQGHSKNKHWDLHDKSGPLHDQ
jgi:hypothetical protein